MVERKQDDRVRYIGSCEAIFFTHPFVVERCDRRSTKEVDRTLWTKNEGPYDRDC